jgi:hypothetical protein
MSRMHRPFALAALALAAYALAPASASADEGMWLLNKPPVEQLRKTYGFEATPEWLDHLQKSSVRISTGGSGSIVSDNGLVMTNHHVGRDMIEKLSTKERNLIREGFYAPTLADELPCPDLEVLCLWTIEDVTERVRAAGEQAAKAGAGAQGTAAAEAARRKAMGEIEKEAAAASGLYCNVVTLYQGGLYHLYSYKRYTDVRLVMAPDTQIAFFGGDPDNFEYPRYCLDMTFFRIWENGAPLRPEHYLRWSKSGASSGDLVFVSGHPGGTNRLDTVADLEFQRDVDQPMQLMRLWRREVQLSTFSARNAENRRIAQNDLFSVQNSRKVRTGILGGLQDPALMGKKREAEQQLRAAVAADPARQAQWGKAWDDIAAAKALHASLHRRLTALNALRGSQLFGIARNLLRLGDELPKPSADRLREYRDSELEKVKLTLLSPAPIYAALEVDNLASGLSWMAELLGAADPSTAAALAGKSPRARAAELVAGSKLADPAVRKQLLEGGSAAVLAARDPLIELARALDAENRALRLRSENEIEAVERESYAKIAAARFAILGESVYPDATFTLRLSVGTVKGYREEGQEVAPFTQLAGLYERSEQHGGDEPYDLHPLWTKHRAQLDGKTPFNFVHTNDIIGGNSGSPTVDRKGEVVGLVFDGNIYSTVADVAYEGELGRALSVDSRAILEALRKVYGAAALADELTRASAPAASEKRAAAAGQH